MMTNEEKLAETVFVVEATDFEALMLWKENEETKLAAWVQDNHGYSPHIGEIDGRPIYITVFWVLLNGHRVAFWNACSSVVDHKQIEAWWDKNCCPKWDAGTRVARTDAMNFHHALQAVKELGPKK